MKTLALRRLLPVLLLIFALLWVQSAGAIHTVEHWSHDADDSCAVLFAAERLGHGLLKISVCLVPPRYPQVIPVIPRQPVSSVAAPPFRARAPPAHI